MNILILSRRGALYSTRRLKEECVQLRQTPLVVDPLKCVLALQKGVAQLLHNGRFPQKIGAVIPRVGTRGVDYAISVVRHLELMGVPCVNGSLAIEWAKNKLISLQRLSERGIRVPDTLISRYPRQLDRMTKLVGGTPLIMKLLRGTQGMGVIYAESSKAVASVLETIWSLGEDILLQEYIRESQGSDLRVLVVGGEVVASMRRVGRPGEFRANIHRGGVGVAVRDLPRSYARMAIDSAEALGLELAGVDLLESRRGPLVIEVNASPGFQGLEEATGINVARRIVERAIQLKRQRPGRSGRRRGTG